MSEKPSYLCLCILNFFTSEAIGMIASINSLMVSQSLF